MPNTTVTLHDKTFVPYLSEEKIKDRLAELGQKISQEYEDKNPLLLAVLNGSFVFAADLMRAIDIPAHISFIRLASYKGTKSSGRIQEVVGLYEDITDRHVIVVEDIVDTGRTMEHLLNTLAGQGAASVEVATLLHKPEATEAVLDLRYVGFTIPPKFVVGYGLDYDGLGRNLPALYCLASEA